jgi:hypothetical protein
MSASRWHCYLYVMGRGIVSADVDADGPDEAALAAASMTDQAGGWTVVPGLAVQVSVEEGPPSYQVTGSAPDLREQDSALTGQMDDYSRYLRMPGIISGAGPMYLAYPSWKRLAEWSPPAGTRVGPGGSGPDPSVVVCPVCRAYGGGGHGGGCPNSGRAITDWVRAAR